MVNTKDIRERIEIDFGDRASEVMAIFNAAIAKADYLDNDRIIRCILFLSENNIEKLRKNIEAATADPRDVMYWAEYSNQDLASPKRTRDFNNSFSEAEIGLDG